MPFRALPLLALVAFAPAALAQTLGSVNCKASLREIDAVLKATERKLESVRNSAGEETCSAMRVHVLTLERAGEIFGRCTEGGEREQKVGQADASAAGIRAEIAQSCGG